MSKVNYAVVFSSKVYQSLIYTALNKNDIVFIEPVSDDEKNFLEYVKREAASISNFDAFIIDLGVLKDTDEQITEAIEAIRYIDDNIRIIILEGIRDTSENLMSQCFLNGIYNLIAADDLINTKDNLDKCLLDGMSYKDALYFKDATERRAKKQELKEVQDFQGRTVAFLGTQNRIGTTHCVLSAAYTLRQCGYMVAVKDYTDSRDYECLMNSYEEQLEGNKFSVDDIDFYIKPEGEADEEHQDCSYNFVIYDFGHCLLRKNQDIYINADEKILVTGSKPWELPILASFIKDIVSGAIKDVKILFNLTNPELESDLKKMMKGAGIDKDIYFMEYLSDYSSVSEVVKNMLQIIPKKMKKKFFRK